MIVLDTNVISELMREHPDDAVLEWSNERAASELYTTSITQAEILSGVTLLPRGKRREALAEQAAVVFDSLFSGRVLAFGTEAAKAFASILELRRRAGRPISLSDAQIAAITRASYARLATRNVADFERCGIELLNPWRGPAR